LTNFKSSISAFPFLFFVKSRLLQSLEKNENGNAGMDKNYSFIFSASLNKAALSKNLQALKCLKYSVSSIRLLFVLFVFRAKWALN